jgi:hypothetical protein
VVIELRLPVFGRNSGKGGEKRVQSEEKGRGIIGGERRSQQVSEKVRGR